MKIPSWRAMVQRFIGEPERDSTPVEQPNEQPDSLRPVVTHETRVAPGIPTREDWKRRNQHSVGRTSYVVTFVGRSKSGGIRFVTRDVRTSQELQEHGHDGYVFHGDA
jgi:hypothetical protein